MKSSWSELQVTVTGIDTSISLPPAGDEETPRRAWGEVGGIIRSYGLPLPLPVSEEEPGDREESSSPRLAHHGTPSGVLVHRTSEGSIRNSNSNKSNSVIHGQGEYQVRGL
jgi:hypothetical protein